MNSPDKTIPLKILDIDIDHQTPFSPRIVAVDKNIANGILAPVKIILTSEGVKVFPKPLKAP